MGYKFKIGKNDDCGLIVKHGNKDNVVLFFDEIKDGASYRAVLFRTDVMYQTESFIEEARINKSNVTLYVGEWVDSPSYGSRREIKPHNFENHKIAQLGSVYEDEQLLIQSWENKTCDRYKEEGMRDYQSSGTNTPYKIARIDKVPFSQVKYITTLESNRNDLYINIDFLPCGQYFVILEVEDRNGKIIKETLPYYFKVGLVSNKEVLDAIKNAGRVAGRY